MRCFGKSNVLAIQLMGKNALFISDASPDASQKCYHAFYGGIFQNYPKYLVNTSFTFYADRTGYRMMSPLRGWFV